MVLVEQPYATRMGPSPTAPPARTLLDVFRTTVEVHPRRRALETSDVSLSYRELAERATEVARRLARLGIGPGDKVGVRIPSGTAELYIGILGVLLAGAAYVPVDADDPEARARENPD